VEDFDLPELTIEQIEQLCTIAEEAARRLVHSRIAKKDIELLNVCAEVEGTRPVNLAVDVDIELSQSVKSFEVKILADEAVTEAFRAAENYLRRIACRSPK
jgi:hypothetical protein